MNASEPVDSIEAASPPPRRTRQARVCWGSQVVARLALLIGFESRLWTAYQGLERPHSVRNIVLATQRGAPRGETQWHGYDASRNHW